MKQRIAILILALAVVGYSAVAQTTYALVAGVSSYQNPQNNLGNTTKDAKDIKKVLDKLNVKSALVTSKHANYANIKEKLEKIVSVAKSNDKIMFFFSGHGTTGAFCTYDELFPYSTLVSILRKAKAKEIYCFVDACMSGSVQDVSSSGYNWASNTNMMFFMGCRAEEFSWENQWIGNGNFSKALLKGLRGNADSNQDKKITAKELFNYISRDVTKHTQNNSTVQHPQLIGPSTMHDNVLFVR